jgi:hypothetical protein
MRLAKPTGIWTGIKKCPDDKPVVVVEVEVEACERWRSGHQLTSSELQKRMDKADERFGADRAAGKERVERKRPGTKLPASQRC